MQENIKQTVLDLIKSELYTPMDMREMTAFLALSRGELDGFAAAVEELEREGELCVTKRGKLILADNSGLIRGVFRATTRGFGFVTPEEGKGGDIFVSHDNAHGAMNGDRVMIKSMPSKKEPGERDGEVVRVIERTLTEVVGTVRVIRPAAPRVKKKGKKAARPQPTRFVVHPDDPKHCFHVEVLPAQANGAKDGDKVLVRITRYPDGERDAGGRITRIFGESEGKGANYQAILWANGIKTRFDEETLLEAREIEPGCELCGRLDLRDKVIFTIDGPDAKDFDDAISLERDGDGYLLGVHIADVSEYVLPGSALDAEALWRGTSVYFVDKVVPMLPEELSNGVCSLNRDSDKYALSALIKLDGAGNILEAEFRESVIASKVRGVYPEINDVIERGEASEFFQKYAFLYPDTLPLMLELYEKLLEKSRRRGTMELETAESVILLGEDGMPADILARERGISERMIEQFMLAANEAAASWLTSMALPCVFRVHEEPSAEKVEAFADFIENLGLDARPLRHRRILPACYREVALEAAEQGLVNVVTPVMLRSLMKAKYSAVSGPHFGLGLELYCHFTSPIRRYPDLAVHRIIKTALRGGITPETLPELEAFAREAAERSSETEIRAMNAERDIEDLYKVLFMKDKIGEVYEGIVSSVASFGMFVELASTVEGLVPIHTLEGWYEYDERSRRLIGEGGSFCLGQRVRVMIADCDVVTRRIEFKIMPQESRR